MKRQHIHLPRARGFTLVEALVALLVLSVGLLGVGMLQLSSLSNNYASSLRSQATFLAQDITDRMRANRENAEDGDYNIDLGEAGAAGTIAGDDLVAWKAALDATLPDGDGAIATNTVTVDGIAVTTFTITVAWDDSKGVEDPLELVMETQL
jgi:type IV pilus assembly protein PilV